jgi:multiple sugar transport system permease protein
VLIGSLAAYGLSRFSYKFLWMKNKDISFFFLSQLILPPVVLAMPFLVLYKHLAARHADRPDPRLHADGAANRHLDHARPVRHIPVELEQAALVDGCSIWGAFMRIVLPIALPGMVAAFILSVVLCWNEYFFAALLTSPTPRRCR